MQPKKQQKGQELMGIRALAPQEPETGFFDNGGFGGFGDWSGDRSPVKAQDTIDWSVTTYDLEKLKLDILPCYWEHLLDSLNSIVRVTQRLYIVQEWNYKGHLVV